VRQEQVSAGGSILHYAIDQTKPLEATVRYLVNGKESRFTARAFATGLLSAFGHDPTISIPDFEGEALVNPNALEESSLHLVIQAAALTVTGDIDDKDRNEINRRMHDEVLESDGYSEITYECSKLSASQTSEGQYWVALNGELSMHGVTRSQPVSARVMVNGDTLRATGDFSVRQSDYELKPVSAAGGTVKLKDEIKLSFEITARKA
jgi:polyisoprenoid-binding protein YceI